MIFYLSVILSLEGDLEQLNSLDKVVLREDDSSFTTMPSSKPRKHPFSWLEHHQRNVDYCHGNHFIYKKKGHHRNKTFLQDHSYKYIDNEMQKKHHPHYKDSYGHHVFHNHYANKTNISPIKDAYVPYFTWHIKPFPFQDRKEELDGDEYDFSTEYLDTMKNFH